MADRPGGEPTEQPTPRRLAEARKKGQVARSRELSSAAAFVAAVVALVATGPYAFGVLAGHLHRSITLAARAAQAEPAGAGWNPGGAPAFLSQASALLADAAGATVRALGPVLVAGFAAALFLGALQAGGILTLAPLAPKLERLNPGAGLKRIFSKDQWLQLGRSLLVVGVVGAAGYTLLRDELGRLLHLVARSPAETLLRSTGLVERLLYRSLFVFVLVGAIDYGLAYRKHRKQLMMTREEVKREAKESEGDPHHKAERQRLHREILESQMLEQVRLADCVIVNPTQIAVAIRYEKDRMEAPEVVAKGERLLAERIREEARRHGVPILRNVPLARALVGLDVGAQIPADLYEAVAEVLRFVYGLGGTTAARGGPGPEGPGPGNQETRR